ncbi:MAG: LytR/AlgR family response regulator transcription factor [Bacteroidales bacterium]
MIKIPFKIKTERIFTDPKNDLLTGGLIFVCTFLFAYFFEPFHVDKSEHQFHYFWICSLFAFNATFAFFTISCIRHYTIVSIQRSFHDLLWLLLLLLLIGTLNFMIRPIIYDNVDNLSSRYFLEEIKHAFLFGSLMLLIIRLFLKPLRMTGENPPGTLNRPNKVEIETAIRSDHFYVDPETFAYAESEGNYLTVYTFEKEILKKKLIRMTISDFERCLTDHSYIMRVHRSFIVNFNYIQRVSGNAKGYMLTINQAEGQIPVSRGNSSLFAEHYKTFQNHSSH